MTFSCIMIDPEGRFFDYTNGSHTYSRPILKVGVKISLSDIKSDFQKFVERNRIYKW
jgi:hypothetical protein